MSGALEEEHMYKQTEAEVEVERLSLEQNSKRKRSSA